VWYIIDGSVANVDVIGNTYWDAVYGWTNNQRRAIAEHEIGHLQLIGEIPFWYPDSILMRESATFEELNSIYTPQYSDIVLVNQVYR